MYTVHCTVYTIVDKILPGPLLSTECDLTVSRSSKNPRPLMQNYVMVDASVAIKMWMTQYVDFKPKLLLAK